MPTKTLLTVAEAAKRVGKSRQTIFDKIKRGNLSATVNHDGNKVVDVSELLRVFGALLSDDDVKRNQADKAGQSNFAPLTSSLQLELERAKLHIERRDFEIEQLRARVEELKEREREGRDEKQQLLAIIDRQTLLLAAPTPVKPAAKPKAAPVAKQKPTTRAPAAKTVKKPAAARKVASAKPLAKVPARSKPAPKTVAKTVAKKATRK